MTMSSAGNEWGLAAMARWCSDRDYSALLLPPSTGATIRVVERFDWSGAPLEPGFRRVRVIARQLYVLSSAALGGNASASQAAPEVAEAMIRYAIAADGQFVSRLAPDGSVIDATHDLYDIAFGLFALAWWYRLSGDVRVPEIAEISVSRIHDTLASPSGKGFVARANEPVRHSQNPHMHLFEAALFLRAFTGRPVFRGLADTLYALAIATLFDPETGTLAEEFDAEWRRIAMPETGVTIEPGHHYEWVWLLNRYAVLADRPEALVYADRLFDFAWEVGHDPVTGLVYDMVDLSGRVTGRDLRTWPNAELLKAQIAMCERNADDPRWDLAARNATLDRIWRHFLRPRMVGPKIALGDGWWIDYLRADAATPKCDHAPASTLYHIVFAFSEAMRYKMGRDPFISEPWMLCEDDQD